MMSKKMKYFFVIECKCFLFRVLCFFVFSVFFAHPLYLFSQTTVQDTVDADSHLIDEYNLAGFNAARLGDFELANDYFNKLLKLKVRKFGMDSHQLASTYNNIGILNKNLGEYDRAIENYLKAERLYVNEFGSNYYKLGSVYSNIGNIYKLKGDFVKNFEYQKNSLDVLLVNDDRGIENQVQRTKINITEALLLLKRYDEAINSCFENIQQADDDLKTFYTSLLARIYAEQDKFVLADKYFHETFDILKRISGEGSFDLGLEYTNYVSFLLDNERFDKVYEFNKKAEAIIEKYFTKKSIQYSQVMLNYADYYLNRSSVANALDDFNKKKKDDLMVALGFYQKAIVAATDSFNDLNPASNPKIEQSISEIQLLEIMKKKSTCFDILGELNLTASNKKEAVSNFNSALDAIALSTELVHQIRTGYVSEESRLFLSENQEETFIEAVNICFKLFTQTGEAEYAMLGYEFTEKSKSASFLAAVRDSKAKEFGGIPDSLQRKEDYLKTNISNYKQMLFEENQHSEPDPEKVSLYNSKIFQYSEQYSQLIEYLEDSFPNYYSFKYKDEVVDIASVRNKIRNHDAIVEYLIQEPGEKQEKGKLFRFVITKNDLHFTRIDVDSVFVKDIENVYQFLTSPAYLYTGLTEYKNYTISAFHLYQNLLGDVRNDIEGKELVVIPDDKLSYIPFDALLSELPDTTVMNFRKLPYLVRDYAISYTYSTTLLYNYFEKEREARKSLLAFAPSYFNDERDYQDVAEYRAGLLPLPAVDKEVEYVNRYISGDIYKDTMAQESRFKEYASDYDILHLAMHTILNDTLPMYSKLAFAKPEAGNSEDGWLNTSEIYTMKLRARMAVLSACNTGSGKLQKGEGVMSLARGFLYAGCPSIIMTLWEVEDESGALIMKDFYKMLSKGKSKNEALRLAKLLHIENADPLKSHPHYWLGYVAVGNSEPLFVTKDLYFVVVIFGVLLLLLVDQVLRRRRNSKKKGRHVILLQTVI